jgi:hypothetical protein
MQAVTGLGRDLVKAAILTGALPGCKVGNRYTISHQTFVAFCEGRWVPVHRPVFTEKVQPITAISSDALITKRTSKKDMPS